MQAFGTPEKQILIEPVFAQWIQSAHGKSIYEFNFLLSSTSSNAFSAGQDIWLPGWLNGINDSAIRLSYIIFISLLKRIIKIFIHLGFFLHLCIYYNKHYNFLVF
jgi:photosystem I P700 chlorophyll a apoprotein A2